MLDGVLNQDFKYRFGTRDMRSVLARPSVYGVTIRDAIHKLLQKTSVLLQKTTGQMLINVKVRTYNEAREYPELGQH